MPVSWHAQRQMLGFTWTCSAMCSGCASTAASQPVTSKKAL